MADMGKTFIERACGRDETLFWLGGIHGFFMFIGLVWFICFIALGLGVDHITNNLSMPGPDSVFMPFFTFLESFGDWGMVLCICIGAAVYFSHLAAYATTHIGLTNRRLLLRTGLLHVRLNEIDLDEIKSERVDHGLVGRFLGYGEIKLDARFVQNLNLPKYVSRPYELLRAIHEARSALADSFVVSANVPLRAVQRLQDGSAEFRKPEVLDETADYIIYKKKKP